MEGRGRNGAKEQLSRSINAGENHPLKNKSGVNRGKGTEQKIEREMRIGYVERLEVTVGGGKQGYSSDTPSGRGGEDECVLDRSNRVCCRHECVRVTAFVGAD